MVWMIGWGDNSKVQLPSYYLCISKKLSITTYFKFCFLFYNYSNISVTLYHWDLPQALQDQGGWLNPEVAFWFENYARTVFQEFGDRVKIWITINEPWVVAIEGHSIGDMAPGMKGPGILEYKVAHNLIRSHAKAYRVYQNEFFASQGGMESDIKYIFQESAVCLHFEVVCLF